MSTTTRVIKCLAAQNGTEVSYINPEYTLSGDLHMDSIDMLEAVMMIEDEFDINIDDHDAITRHITSVQGIVDYIDSIQAVEK